MDGKIKTSTMNKIGSSAFHLFVYITLLTLISVATSAQCDNVSLACNNGINISTNNNCEAELCVNLMLENSVEGFTIDDFVLSLTDEDDVPLTGTTTAGNCHVVNESHVGIIKASVSLPICGVSCWGYINLEDKVGPGFVQCDGTEFGLGTTDITCEDFIAGVGVVVPTLSGSCNTSIEPTFEDENTGIQCSGIYSGTIVRTWTASDESGNSTICKQRFRILKFDINNVVFPEDTVHLIDFPCDTLVTHPDSLGYPIGIECPNVMYFYNDIYTESCGAQKKFLRDWFVIDWCTGESRTDGQVVKSLDVRGPQGIDCGPRIRHIQASGFSCTAKAVLDPYQELLDGVINASDCSGPLSIDVSFKLPAPGSTSPSVGPFIAIQPDSNNLFAIPAILRDTTWVRYCFTDDCGNGPSLNTGANAATFTNCCDFELVVSDNQPPTAICEGFTKVSLSPTGTTEVFAHTFDDHSYDACGSVVGYEAKRVTDGCNVGTNFSDKVRFCCNDVGETLSVILKVLDDDGNFSECTSRVCVTDLNAPTVNCPDDVTIDCLEDYTDSSIVDNATGTNGCLGIVDADGVDYDLTDFDVSCSTGTIIRNIYFENTQGDTINSCAQLITVSSDSTSAMLLEGDYTGPSNVMVDVCNAFSIHPDQIGYPTTTKTFGCLNIGISYEDSNPVTSTQDGVCYTIVRSWTVVDWCRYDSATPGSHALYFVQNITVSNSGVPTISCPDMQMVITEEINCRADIELNATLVDACSLGSVVTWAIDIDSDTIVDLRGDSLSASGNYPVGEHLITFTAVNECQGTPASCTFPFIIKGDRPPLPICLASVTWTLSENGQAVVWASDFDLKSEGGCDGADSLTFSFISPLDAAYPQGSQTFTCNDLPNGVSESIMLEVYIVDESGVYESCNVILVLQDSNDICPDVGSSTTLGGSVMTEMGEAVENVMVNLSNTTDAISDMKMTTTTGNYAFLGVDYYDDYAIAPEHNVDPLNGVSTLDLVQIQRHILGLENLDTPYKLIAADVNDDHRINGLDLVQLRKLILGIFIEFPQNDSWVFVSDDHQFMDVTAPWDYDNAINVEDLLGSKMDVDFTAVKVGDVNNSASVDDNKVELRSGNSLFLSGIDVSFERGELVQVPFVIEEDIEMTGVQLTVEFDAESLLFQGVDADKLDMTEANFALLNNHNGVITISYSDIDNHDLVEGDNLFNLYFESKSTGELSEMIKISSTVLQSEIYNSENEIRNIEYVFRGQGHAADGIELFQNQPNPFSESTTIAFYMPYTQNVNLNIYNADGKMIWQQSGQFGKGISEFVISTEDLDADGILIFRLESRETSITRKMILIK